MGGTIRKDFSTKVSHLISYSTHGEKYRVRVCASLPVVASKDQRLLLVLIFAEKDLSDHINTNNRDGRSVVVTHLIREEIISWEMQKAYAFMFIEN